MVDPNHIIKKIECREFRDSWAMVPHSVGDWTGSRRVLGVEQDLESVLVAGEVSGHF